MDIRQLKYFLAVAEEGLITKAAKRLHITQSPLSQQMILLEKELGVPLLQRNKKHIRLTEAGQVLKRRSEQLLDLTQVTLNEVRETSIGLRGKLTIGTINSSGRLMLPEVIRVFYKEYPLISFDLHQGNTQHILESLNSHLIDVAFIRLPIDSFLYESIIVPPENMVVIVNSHDTTINIKDISLKQLRNHPLLIHRRYKSIIVDYFHQNGFNPNVFVPAMK